MRAPRRGGRLGLDRIEIAALVCLFLLALAPLVAELIRVWIRGGLVTGSDGLLVVDPLQYLNWLRQSGEHLAIGNLYDLAPGSRPFVHPGALVSGLLNQAGLGIVASYMVWKPIAVAALFAGTLLYVRRFLQRTGDRHLALVLALFGASPFMALVGWSGLGGVDARFHADFIGGELWLGNYLWGYLFTAISVGLMPLALLAYERGRAGGPRRMLVLAAAAGLFCAWFQPWQGATIAGVVVVAELVSSWRAKRSAIDAIRDAAGPLVATAAPLVYYYVLARTDASWALAGTANDFPRWPAWILIFTMLPLALPAAFAYRLPAPKFGDIALRVWPIVALAVYFQPAGTFPFHAFQGLALPLIVLAVLALRAWLGARPLPAWPVAIVLVLLIVPGTVYRIDGFRKTLADGLQAHYLRPGEHDALVYLDKLHEPGGVLASYYIGPVIPAYTGRETWVGAGSWTPDFRARAAQADRVVEGRLTPAQAERIVRGSGARFVLSDCNGRPDVSRLLRGFTDPPKRFGCAAVYRVRG